MAFPLRIVDTFAGQNWLITPAALAVNEAPPRNIHDQKWLLTLSGVGLVNLEGNSTSDWLHETLLLLPTIVDPINYAIGVYSIPRPPGTEGNEYSVGFQVEQLAPFASLSSIFDQNESINAGFAVDVWRPNHYGTGRDAFTNLTVASLYTGLQVDVGVIDTDAWLYRVGYNITILGKIIFTLNPFETLFRSDFDQTAVMQPPSPQQAVGTANVDAGVSVINPPPQVVSSGKWVQIKRSKGPGAPNSDFLGQFSEFRGDGVYTFSATIVMPSLDAGSNEASISFEAFGNPIQSFDFFTHLDLLASNRVRVDDGQNTVPDFGSFPRDRPFLVQVTLNINATASTVKVTLSGSNASGEASYTVLSNDPDHAGGQTSQQLSRQFGAIRLWQGSPWSGAFDATSISVTRAAF